MIEKIKIMDLYICVVSNKINKGYNGALAQRLSFFLKEKYTLVFLSSSKKSLKHLTHLDSLINLCSSSIVPITCCTYLCKRNWTRNYVNNMCLTSRCC